jgi:hypothetical protein
MLSLLESVIDGDRLVWRAFTCNLRKCAPDADQEERFCLFFAPRPMRSSNELFSLRHENCLKQPRVHAAQGTPQPGIEEVRQLRIADVVVVRRISRDQSGIFSATSPRIRLGHYARRAQRKGIQHLSHGVRRPANIATSAGQRLGLRKRPDHRQSLSSEGTCKPTHARLPKRQATISGRRLADRECQVDCDCIGIRCRTDAPVTQRQFGRLHCGVLRVVHGPIPGFDRQVRERCQSNKLPRGKEMPKRGQAVGGAHPASDHCASWRQAGQEGLPRFSNDVISTSG